MAVPNVERRAYRAIPKTQVLCIWAEMHANAHEATSAPNTSMRQSLFSIVRRLEAQHPEIKTPLTLGGEARKLKQIFPNMETNIFHEPGFDPTAQETGDAVED